MFHRLFRQAPGLLLKSCLFLFRSDGILIGTEIIITYDKAGVKSVNFLSIFKKRWENR